LNIGTGIPLSIRSIVKKIQKIAKGGVPKFGEIPIRSGETMALYADTSKTEIKLNWFAKTNLDERLEVIIERAR
jgi:nucleoside-diphosphate-sugar epimerase